MAVSNGQLANSTTFNTAFMSRTVDTSTTGVVALNNAGVASGTSVPNAQREHNSIASYVGKTLNSAKDDLPVWTASEIGTALDTLFDRIEALSLAFESTSGHAHDGTAEGAPISLTSVTGWQTGDFDIVSGSDTFSVVFGDAQVGAAYGIAAVLVNTVDTDPQMLTFVITDRTTGGFDVKLSAPTDSGNYKLKWAVFE
jgi:hypothetical protein